MNPEKFIIQANSLPIFTDNLTGERHVLVRDDSKATGRYWVAPVGRQTEMRSLRVDQFLERFTKQKPIEPDATPKRPRGRPRGSRNKPKA